MYTLFVIYSILVYTAFMIYKKFQKKRENTKVLSQTVDNHELTYFINTQFETSPPSPIVMSPPFFELKVYDLISSSTQ